MGIHRHARPYRRSRAGTKLFHKITSIILQHRDKTTESLSNSVNNSAFIRCGGMFNTADQPYTLKCGLVNCQLVVSKTQLIQTEVSVNKLDICALTETWIKKDDKLTMHCICPSGYKCIALPNKMGGWIAIVHREEINTTLQNNSCTPNLEHAVFNIDNKDPQESNQLHLVYRPPDSSVTFFVDEISDKFERDIIKPGQITLLDDFNIKMNKPEDADTIIFSDFLESFGLETELSV